MTMRRRLYKPERRPARDHGVLAGVGAYPLAPVALPDANAGEVAKAIFALARESGVIVGRGSGYDAIKDEYTVIGKSRVTGRAQDFKVSGSSVADVIVLARMLNGGPMKLGRLRNAGGQDRLDS